MIILSDNHNSTLSHFGNKLNHLDPNFENLITVANIQKKIFSSNNNFKYNCDKSSYWENVFISKYASESQFDIINKLVSNNIELPENFICLAEEGNGFHGFRNRSWVAKKGNIHLSLYFTPKNADKYFHAGLLILAAVSVLQTIDSIPELKGLAKTKWVNDIVINQSKVCGIISQSFSTGNKITGAVIGIGLNVNAEPSIAADKFTKSATSLSELSEVKNINLSNLLNILMINLGNSIHLLENGKYLDLLKIYCERSDIIGREVDIYSDSISGENILLHEGNVIGINKNLELILENPEIIVKSGRLAYKK